VLKPETPLSAETIMQNSQLEIIINSFPQVEAAVKLSRDGLPLDWRCRGSASIEEISSIAAGLVSFGYELELVSDASSAQLTVETDHGAMLVRAFEDDSLVLILSSRGCSVQDIETKMDEISIDITTKKKEISYGKNS
jgi:predicted regulator of Ras-like GTPase activity (Roadblock/LC7/MglB family)